MCSWLVSLLFAYRIGQGHSGWEAGRVHVSSGPSGESAVVSVDSLGSVALVGTQHRVGLGSGPGIWAGVESVGAVESSGVGGRP